MGTLNELLSDSVSPICLPFHSAISWGVKVGGKSIALPWFAFLALLLMSFKDSSKKKTIAYNLALRLPQQGLLGQPILPVI